MRREAVRIAALVLAGFAVCANSAGAQGYGVYEHDACTMARAGTGVAMPCNASAVFFNPAGILRAPGSTATSTWSLSVGGTYIKPDFAFTDSATQVTTDAANGGVLVPNFHVTRQMSPRWALGLGVFAPYGLISEWPSDFAGRFVGYRSELKSIYIQPTIAFQITPRIRFGAGFDYIHSTVDLKQRVDLAGQAAPAPAPAGTTLGMVGVPAGTDFADAHLHGGSWAAGAHFGVIIQPLPRVSFGARYLLRATADIQGDADFTQLPTGITLGLGNPFGVPAGTPLDSVVAPQFRTGGALVTQHVSTRVPLPEQLVLGLAFTVTDQLTLLGDYQWTNWERFEKLAITFADARLGTRTLWEDYEATDGWRFGAQFDVNPNISLRGGVLWHDGGAPDNTVTPLLPEGDRVEQTVGIGFRIGTRGRIDVAYQHITQQDRRGRVIEAPRGQGAAFNSGLYTGGANLFGASLVWEF